MESNALPRRDDSRFTLQRDRLLAAAAHCFNHKGYSGTSLKDVAQRLNLTDAALYYYVKNKEELVYQCYLRAADVGREAMQRACEDGSDGLDKVVRYLRYHVELMVGERGPVAIMSEIPALTPEHREHVLELSRQHSTAFEALLDEGIDDGSVLPCDVRMTGNAIMGSINWIPKWHHGDPDVARQIVQEFPAILSTGLAARAPHERPPT
ncbi:MAG: TetR/AcrR family transcriptional regulator [Pseudomonadota bacterium]